MNRKILFIAPSSFPLGDAESIVNVKLLSVLSRRGYIIDLISKDKKWENFPSINTDTYNVKLNSLSIVSVDNKINFKTLFLHIICYFKFSTVFKGAHWALEALFVAESLIKTNKYDYIITRSSPSFLIGYYLKKKYNIKWVATWNDPFPMIKYPPPYGQGVNGNSLNVKKTIEIMSLADFYIFPTERLRSYMNKYIPFNLDITKIIPHVVLESTNNYVNNDGYLKLIHTGNLKSPRNAKTFLTAFSIFISKYPDAKIKVSFMGASDPDLESNIIDLKLLEYVSIIPSVDYLTSLKIILEYDVAVIIEANCEEGIFLPTKVSDYMQCGKNIFAISPLNGVLNDLYKENSIKYFAITEDVMSILNELIRINNDFNNDRLAFPVHKFEYTEDYVFSIFESLKI